MARPEGVGEWETKVRKDEKAQTQTTLARGTARRQKAQIPPQDLWHKSGRASILLYYYYFSEHLKDTELEQ